MKGKKGFTLIELLVVVVIIGILLLIAVPSVSSYMKRGTKEYYSSLEDTVKLAGRDYLNDYRALLPREINNVTVIDLDELTSNKYIDEVVDSNGNKCRAKITAKKVGKNEYEYYSCLMCDDYDPEGNDDECQFDENNNITAETKNYRVVVDTGEYEIDANGIYIVDQGEDFDLPYAKAYYTQNGSESKVSDQVVGNPKIINTNKLGTTTVTYIYKGAKAEIKVKVVDRINPSIPQVVLRYDDEKGKIYKGEWYSGDIYQEFESTDYSEAGVSGSGINRYEVSTDGKTYTALKSNNQTSSENGEYSYYIRSIDKSGNVSDSNTYSLKIDKEVPKCELEVKSGTLGSNGWYTTNITIGFKNITEKVSSIKSQTISQEQVTENTTGITITGKVIDQAGNVGTCSIDVKVDKFVPTIVAKNTSNYITTTTGATITGYFNITTGISSGTTVCKVGTTSVTNTDNLALGVNTVTCTTTSGSGLSKSASTTFRHQYDGTARCNNGRTLSNGNCTYYYSNNVGQCGCKEYNSCQHSSCGVSSYNSCANSACGAKSCETSACGTKTCANAACGYKTCANAACGEKCTGLTDALNFSCEGGYVKHVSGSAWQCCKNKSCATSACGALTCQTSACGYYSCENSACGYKSCQTSACGVASYKSCANSSCSCKTGNSCTKTENSHRYYTCDKTGNTGTNGTLSGSICQF